MSHCQTVQHAEKESLGLFQKVIYHQSSLSLRYDHSIEAETS